MAPLTDSQEMAMCVCQVVSSALSILGSSWILSFLSHCRKLSIYQRFMLGLSAFDVLHSSFILMQPFLIPQSGGRVWARGNDSTCSMLGFFLQLGFAVPLYNGGLNMYYLLTIVYGVTDKTFANKVEPWLHTIAIFFPLITASVGAGIDLYSEQQLGPLCYIGDYPRDCSDERSHSHCMGFLITWAYSAVPMVGTLLFLLVSNSLIYMKVRRTTNRTRRYSDTTLLRMVVSSFPENTNAETEGHTVHPSAKTTWSWWRKVDGNSAAAPTRTTFSRPGRRQTVVANKRTRAVATQAFLYVGASFNSAFWMGLLKHLESQGVHREQESSVYWLVIMAAITFPIQGFLNCIIFVRPRYLRWRNRSPNITRWMAVKLALTTTESPGGHGGLAARISIAPSVARHHDNASENAMHSSTMLRPQGSGGGQHCVLDSIHQIAESFQGSANSCDDSQHNDLSISELDSDACMLQRETNNSCLGSHETSDHSLSYMESNGNMESGGTDRFVEDKTNPNPDFGVQYGT